MRYFPFTALVGQDRLRQALLLTAVNPAVGGVLISGPSGTGKSSAVRALAELMPEIDVVAGCPFACDPGAPECPECLAAVGELPVATRPRRVVDLPLNATEDRVAGSVDVGRALREGERALEPGLLAEANRGILYVDEINLLDDHIADLLLDAAALGTNVVEREGVSYAHPARFLLVGTMNPEEGELRPQLADRIGLRVDVTALTDPVERGEVMRRRERFRADPAGFHAEWSEEQARLRSRMAVATRSLGNVRVPDRLYAAIGALVPRLGVTSHRADLAVLECAKATAALDGRSWVEVGDVASAAGLAVAHRLVTDPFSPPRPVHDDDVDRALQDVLEVETDPKAPAPARTGPARSAMR